MKKKILSLLVLLSVSASVFAQFVERITTFTDKDCYVAGERVYVSVSVTDDNGKSQGLSKVAYVEISDTQGLQAQAMVQLTQGRGWAEVALPATMHSGCYQLTTYTRNLLPKGEEAFARSLIAVINTQQMQPADQVTFHPSRDKGNAVRRTYKAGQMAHISLPSDTNLVIRAVSVVRTPIDIDLYEAPAPSAKVYAEAGRCIPELEGHIVKACPTSAQPAKSLLAGVGKGFAVFEGIRDAKSGEWQYVTSQMNGSLPMVVNGYDEAFQPVTMEIQSPYAQVLPTALPVLDVYASEEDLLRRTNDAQREAQLVEFLAHDTLPYTATLLSRQPERLYKVDDWAHFSTIRKTLTEYVMDVYRRTQNGRTYLFTSNIEMRDVEKFPALVLLDGVPVYDVDAFMNYDARLLQYIQIYTGVYTFGNTLYHGVVSFITHKGLLSNFQLDKGTKLVRYDFPQQRPAFTQPQGAPLSTVFWNPLVDAREVDFPVPHASGIYQIILHGTDGNGKAFRSASEIEVESN